MTPVQIPFRLEMESIMNGACTFEVKEMLCHYWRLRDQFGIRGVFNRFKNYDVSALEAAGKPYWDERVNKDVLSRLTADESSTKHANFVHYYYNYILYDSTNMDENCSFEEFIHRVYYVGKGIGGRMYEHFQEAALSYDKMDYSYEKGLKIGVINNIWKSGGNVGLLSFNMNCTENLAHAMEFAIIQALDLKEVTNVVNGTDPFRMDKDKKSYRAPFTRDDIDDQFHIGGLGLSMAYKMLKAGGVTRLLLTQIPLPGDKKK